MAKTSISNKTPGYDSKPLDDESLGEFGVLPGPLQLI